ncbi:MAG: LysE family translocator [Halolamina sp.]
MFDVVTSLVAGAAFGLALAAPPGPMNAVIAEESVLRGWGAGVKAGLGAGLADFVFFLLALGGVVRVLDRTPAIQGVMFAAGGLLMLYFAYGAALGARSTFAPSSVDAEAGTGVDGDKSTGFRRAFVLALTNPFQILFWLTVGVGLLDPGHLDVLAVLPEVGDSLAGWFVVETGSPALIVGLFGGIGFWLVSFPTALARVGRRVESFAPIVAGASAVVLGGSGISFLFEAWRVLG